MNKRLKLKICLVAVIILIIIIISICLKKIVGVSVVNLDVNEIERILDSNTGSSVLIYMLLNLIRPVFMIIPVWIFAVASGVIYGPLLGSIYSLIGVYLSATVAFYLARFLGRSFFLSIFGEKFRELDNKIEGNGFKVIFVMRVTVVFPFDPLSFMAGLSRIKYRPYIVATVLGSIPETIIFNYLGLGLKNILSLKLLIILSIVLLVVFALVYLRKRII